MLSFLSMLLLGLSRLDFLNPKASSLKDKSIHTREAHVQVEKGKSNKKPKSNCS